MTSFDPYTSLDGVPIYVGMLVETAAAWFGDETGLVTGLYISKARLPLVEVRLDGVPERYQLFYPHELMELP